MNNEEKAYCVFEVLQLLAPNILAFTSKQTKKNQTGIDHVGV